MFLGIRLASVRAVLALLALLAFGTTSAAASPTDVLVDYGPDGIIQGEYTVEELNGALRLVRGRDGNYESFADAVQMKIAEVLTGGHRSSERRPERPAPPPPAVPATPAAPVAPGTPEPPAPNPTSPPPPAPGEQGSQEVLPPPPAASPVKPAEQEELPRLPDAAAGPRQSEISIPRPPTVEPGEGPPWAFVALAAAAAMLAAGGLGAAGWRRLRGPSR